MDLHNNSLGRSYEWVIEMLKLSFLDELNHFWPRGMSSFWEMLGNFFIYLRKKKCDVWKSQSSVSDTVILRKSDSNQDY